jgi:hypothetical protein
MIAMRLFNSTSFFLLSNVQWFANLVPFTVAIYLVLVWFGYWKLRKKVCVQFWTEKVLMYGVAALVFALTYFLNDVMFSFCFAFRYGFDAVNNGTTGLVSGVIDLGWALVVLWLVLPMFRQGIIGVNWLVVLGFLLNGCLVVGWMYFTPSYLNVDYRAAINHGVEFDGWIWSFLGNYLLGKPIIAFTYLAWWWRGVKADSKGVLLNLPSWRK